MTISELKILIDLNKDHVEDILNSYCKKCKYGYFFIDDNDGLCYLFNANGDEDDIAKVKCIYENMIPITIKKIVISDSVKTIGSYTFSNCTSLKSILIPDSVESIGDWVFFDCTALESISIPDSVESIGNRVFSMCSSLTTITIPDSVENIGNVVFSYCTSLKEAIFEGKTIEEVKKMKYYPFGIEDKSIIKCN